MRVNAKPNKRWTADIWLLTQCLQIEGCATERTFEAFIEKHDRWCIRWADTVPRALSRGRKNEKVQENLKEAAQPSLESQQAGRESGANTMPAKAQTDKPSQFHIGVLAAIYRDSGHCHHEL